jgi:hypothetical protein
LPGSGWFTATALSRGCGLPEDGGSKRRGIRDLGPGWISAIASLIAALVAVAGLFIFKGSESSSTSAETSSAAATVTSRETLPPAPMLAAVGLCSGPLQVAVDDTAGPVTCPDGSLNRRVWEYYAEHSHSPDVMALGPNSTPDEVQEAMCSDLSAGRFPTIPIGTEIYRITAIYNAWEFSLDPTDGFPEYCQG